MAFFGYTWRKVARSRNRNGYPTAGVSRADYVGIRGYVFLLSVQFNYFAKARLGGLSTSIKSVRANLIVSVCVAITGIGAPMGLSFILSELVGATSIQAFAAGAALSATSLGTTFTILSTTNLISTRLGTVTTSAAMLDDVVGLVMVQIISNLGGSASSFSSLTVIRPVFVSIGFAAGLFVLSAYFVKPLIKRILIVEPIVPQIMRSIQFAFLYHTVILVGIVAGTTYAGTSSLFAAYLAGVIVTWIDGIIKESKIPPGDALETSFNSSNGGIRDSSTRRRSGQTQISNASSTNTQHGDTPTGEQVYEKYYKQPVNRILRPLFFVSISSDFYVQTTNVNDRHPLVLRFPSPKCLVEVWSGAVSSMRF